MFILLGWLWGRQQRWEAPSHLYGQSRQWISAYTSQGSIYVPV